jgi:hypothetical protein
LHKDSEATQLARALVANAPGSHYIERRVIPSQGYADQTFLSIDNLREVPELWGSQVFRSNFEGRGDVYFSVATRRERLGTSDAVGVGLSVWADMDDEHAVHAFPVPPSAVVQTSPPRKKFHAYWFLDEPTPDLQLLLRINRAIPNADPNAIDKARVLRAPGYSNMKYNSGTVAKLVRLEADLRYSVQDMVKAFPPVSAAACSHPHLRTSRAPSWLGLVFDAVHDHLERGGYRPRSQGRTIGVMSLCPLHHDTNQSLSMHPTRGYHCFGCKAGGRLTDLAHKLNVRVGQ